VYGGVIRTGAGHKTAAKKMHCLRCLFQSYRQACRQDSFVFPEDPCCNRVPVGVSGLASGGCGCPAGTWPETAFFSACHREKQIRSGRESASGKNRIPDFTHMLCHACQSGKLIIFLYPSGSTGAHGRSSANFGKTDELRSFHQPVWTGNGSLVWTRNCAVSSANQPRRTISGTRVCRIAVHFRFPCSRHPSSLKNVV